MLGRLTIRRGHTYTHARTHARVHTYNHTHSHTAGISRAQVQGNSFANGGISSRWSPLEPVSSVRYSSQEEPEARARRGSELCTAREMRRTGDVARWIARQHNLQQTTELKCKQEKQMDRGAERDGGGEDDSQNTKDIAILIRGFGCFNCGHYLVA